MRDGIVLEKARPRTAARIRDFVDLTKPRITLMVVLTGAVGYILAGVTFRGAGLIHVMAGTALVAAGASVLNQVRERDADARMTRTAKRAIPAGRIAPGLAFLFGMGLGITGTLYILLTLNLVTAILAVATIASYVLVYTPLKKVTPLNTWVGAVPGALPPVGGWAAATGGSLGLEPWALFLVLFLWQIPHFLALAWLLREDYRKGGFRMLPVVDPDGKSTGAHVALAALLLVPASALPFFLGTSGIGYLVAALLLSAVYAIQSLAMARRINAPRSRAVFLGSILYLPALMGALLIDKLVG